MQQTRYPVCHSHIGLEALIHDEGAGAIGVAELDPSLARLWWAIWGCFAPPTATWPTIGRCVWRRRFWVWLNLLIARYGWPFRKRCNPRASMLPTGL